MQKADSQDSIVSLERGLEVLRAFHNESTALGIHDLMRATGLPKATVARLAHTLVTLGYLEQTHFQGRYHLADRVIDIGNAALANISITRVATPILQEVADRFNMSTALGAADRTDMVYLAYCRGKDTVTLRLQVGALVPMHLTAMGRAHIWALSPEARSACLERIRRSGAEMGAVQALLDEAFAEIDATGFCVSRGDWRPDIYAVAVPLVINDGQTVLALNCGVSRHGLIASTFREEIGPALLVAARNIANTMADLKLKFFAA